MIWTNTDYAIHLIEAARRLLEHTGPADAPGLGHAIERADTLRKSWGHKLHSNPVPGWDVQDHLENLAPVHRAFDTAIADLEAAMRRCSLR